MIVHKSIYKFVETLLLFYKEESGLENLLEKCLQMEGVLKKNKIFREFLLDSAVNLDNKKDFAVKMLQPLGFDQFTINTVLILIESHFSKYIKDFFKILIKEIYVKLNIKHIYVISDCEMDKEQTKRLENSFKKRMHPSKLIFDYKIDKSLIMGIKVKYDDMVEELSLESQLKKVERQLKKYSRAINFI